MSAPPPVAGGAELLTISRLQAQLLASEAEVARLRAENAQLRHEALLQRAVMASSAAQGQPVAASPTTATASANRLRASSIAGVSALCSMKRPPSPSSKARGAVDATVTAGSNSNSGGEMDTQSSLCLIPGCNEKSEGDRTSHLCREHHGQLRSAASTAATEAIANASTS